MLQRAGVSLHVRVHLCCAYMITCVCACVCLLFLRVRVRQAGMEAVCARLENMWAEECGHEACLFTWIDWLKNEAVPVAVAAQAVRAFVCAWPRVVAHVCVFPSTGLRPLGPAARPIFGCVRM